MRKVEGGAVTWTLGRFVWRLSLGQSQEGDAGRERAIGSLQVWCRKREPISVGMKRKR